MNNHVLQIVIFWLPHTRPLIDSVKIVIADSFSTLEFFVHWASILTPSITLILMVLGLLNSSYTWIGPFWRKMRIILCEPCFCYTVVHGLIMIHDPWSNTIEAWIISLGSWFGLEHIWSDSSEGFEISFSSLYLAIFQYIIKKIKGIC